MTKAIPNFDSLNLTYNNGVPYSLHIKLNQTQLYRSNLNVRDGDVEEVIHVCVPHNSNIGDDHCSEITLVTVINTKD